ncbi:MAG: MbnP family protein [Cyclobacteriaceae bacterium]
MKKLIFFLPLIFLLSCGEEETSHEPIALTLTFDHLVGSETLALNTGRYTNAEGEVYSIQKFQYYISNVRLRNTRSGEVYTENDSYHLISTADGSAFSVELEELPSGEFNQLEFAIGVDNASNTSTDKLGDLDPSNDMAWDWNTGYKFVSLEGLYYPESGDNQALVYHIGGDINYRVLTFALSEGTQQVLNLSPGKSVEINLNVDIAQMFQTPNQVSFTEHAVVMFDPFSQKVADNYASDMFTIETIE